MNKLVDEAPYHPGYEDAVVITRRSESVYRGMDPAKMLWKSKPLSNSEIVDIASKVDWKDINYDWQCAIELVRLVEERHGIK